MSRIDNLKGKGFKKGQSGNPAGRPEGVPNVKTRLIKLLNLVQKKKNAVTKEDGEFTIAEQMDAAMVLKALKGDVAAYKELNDRIEGKANQHNTVEAVQSIKVIRE